MPDFTQQVTVDQRFNGPPGCGNGGYVCGLLAASLPGTVEVTLKEPIPLDKHLLRKSNAVTAAQLLDAERLLAEARVQQLRMDVPDPPDYQAACDAATRYIGFDHHSFPHCFVCGPDRVAGDGLQIFTGPVEGKEMVAAPWCPDSTLANADGLIRREFIWAALDCPGAFAHFIHASPKPVVLGRFHARVEQDLLPGERCVVTGWPLGRHERKLFSGTAVFNEKGDLCAVAQAVWIALKG